MRLRIDQLLRKKRMALFFRYDFDSQGRLTYASRQEEIAREALLYGLFIIKTNSFTLARGEGLSPVLIERIV
jgi:hypothetical protein